jgi:hypothetical protein
MLEVGGRREKQHKQSTMPISENPGFIHSCGSHIDTIKRAYKDIDNR